MLTLQQLRQNIGNLGAEIQSGRAVSTDRINALEDAAKHWASVSKDPRPICNLAWISRESNDLVTAARLLDPAIELFPEDAWVRIGLAHVLERKGEFKRARDLLEPLVSGSLPQGRDHEEALLRAKSLTLRFDHLIDATTTDATQASINVEDPTSAFEDNSNSEGPGEVPLLSARMLARVGRYAEAFQSARPFKHVVVDHFFTSDFAEHLLAEFPDFDPAHAINEMGKPGGKAVNTHLRSIGPAYRKLYDTLGTAPFLRVIARICGISDLIIDPKMFGGGTHDNRHGQELDPHVDFNLDESETLHRRLNAIVYMNKEWKPEWGGTLEIHSDPWEPDQNQIRSIDPLFNRCVIFETNEHSWHGFPRIDLPEGKRHLSRKSISVYLYTKDRPAHEIVPRHGTFYVQRPLPPHIREGCVLTANDVRQIKSLLRRRDEWLRAYQKMELDKNREISVRDAMIRHFKASSANMGIFGP